MPSITPFRLVAACALVAILSLSIVASAAAKGRTAQLRVVGAGGKVLAEKASGASGVSVKASPKANCFGPDSAGSGKSVSVPGNTALSLLARGAQTTKSLRPLLISDAFDFGLALCGIGGNVAKGEGSWYVKVNHKGTSVGADQAKVKRGDEVLFALATSFPYPNELWLKAPKRAQKNKPFTVRVFSYDEKGKRKPARNVKVTGAESRTGADGRTKVTLRGPRRLIARLGKEIPSSKVGVCVGGKCPK